MSVGDSELSVQTSSKKEKKTQQPSRPEKRIGRAITGDFPYYYLEGPVKSAKLRNDLSKWDQMEYVIGVLFEDGSFVWGMEAPRHTALETSESKHGLARIQAAKPIFGYPQLNIYAEDKNAAIKLASLTKMNSPNPLTHLRITMFDSLSTPNRKILRTAYDDKLLSFDPQKLKEIEALTEFTNEIKM